MLIIKNVKGQTAKRTERSNYVSILNVWRKQKVQVRGNIGS